MLTHYAKRDTSLTSTVCFSLSYLRPTHILYLIPCACSTRAHLPGGAGADPAWNQRQHGEGHSALHGVFVNDIYYIVFMILISCLSCGFRAGAAIQPGADMRNPEGKGEGVGR